MAHRKDSFLKGAMILTIAGFLVKVLGAFYRIPLALMIKDEGMGLYQMAYPIYLILLSISTAGLPTAISKMVAEDAARGRYRNAYRIFVVSLAVLASVGLGLTLILIAGANYLSLEVYQNPKAYYPIISIAPAIFFVSIMSCFRGFFQGLQNMTPSAVSQVVEQIGRVVAVFILASLLLPYGVEYAAAGAAFGPVAGSIAGLIVLIIVYYNSKSSLLLKFKSDIGSSLESSIHIIRRLFAFAIPITLGGLISPFMNLADAAIVSKRLQEAGFSVKRATELFGQLTGMAAPIINLPVVVTTALSASLVPAISEAMALGNRKMVASRAETGIRMSIIFALPAAVGMYALAEPITVLLYKNAEAGISLKFLAWGVVFLAITQTSTGILQGIGKTMIPVQNMLIGAVIKVIINYALTGIPNINIKGAAIGTVIGYLIPAFLNFVAVVRWTAQTTDLNQMVIKPVLASIFMGAGVELAYGSLVVYGFPQNKATIVTIAFGALVYAISLLLIGGIKKTDLELLPGGKRIIGIISKFKLFRR
ncbi:MAG: putative polysaccharide biosynthesis protein [Tepidanaerobacteraceae bacterium]|nr:polysaccharide biosynthesis protein [Thermoanaerobacterales bacterium]